MNNKERRKLLGLLLDLGSILLLSGAEIYRVEDTIERIGRNYGASSVDVFALSSGIFISISFGDELISENRRIKSFASNNFMRIEKINNLSRRVCNENLSISEFERELLQVKNKREGSFFYCAGGFIAAGSFAMFFGGDIYDAIVSGFFGLVLCLMSEYLFTFFLNTMVFNFVSSFLVGMATYLIVRLFPGLNQDMIVIGEVMILVPGVPLMNAIRDTLLGDTITGTMRFVEIMLYSISLALGFMLSLYLLGGN